MFKKNFRLLISRHTRPIRLIFSYQNHKLDKYSNVSESLSLELKFAKNRSEGIEVGAVREGRSEGREVGVK